MHTLKWSVQCVVQHNGLALVSVVKLSGNLWLKQQLGRVVIILIRIMICGASFSDCHKDMAAPTLSCPTLTNGKTCQ